MRSLLTPDLSRILGVLLMMAPLVSSALIGAASAQQPLAQTLPGVPPPSKPKSTPPKASKSDSGSTPSSDSGLRQRIDTLEEQLVDMQVVMGTLDSLLKSGGGASLPRSNGVGENNASSGADQQRIVGLEAQVRALTAQVQQLSDQLRSQGPPNRRSDFAPQPSAAPAPPPPGGFGVATVEPAGADPIEGVLSQSQPSATPASLSSSSSEGNPKQLYETAYGYLLQQDYGAAEAAFDDFLKRYPSDNLAGNAQFWLGESFFVRGQFKSAAGAFLKGYQTYARSSKAPDSLLKLAMSLGRMNQKDASCSSFNELASKFPNATSDVKSRAAVEKQRVGCS